MGIQMFRKPHVQITAVYVTVATLWILFSDTALYAMFNSEFDDVPAVSIIKGLAFVSVTGGLLYLYLRQAFHRRFAVEAELETRLQEIQAVQGKLESSERRFRKAVEESPLPVMLFAEDGEVLSLSREWSNITGYSKEELRTVEDWATRAYGEKRDIIKDEIDSLFEADGVVHEGEFIINCKDGTQRIWEFASTPLGRLEDGRRIVFSIAFDMTERKALEDELRLYEHIFNQTNLGLAISRIGSSNFDLINHAYAEMHGYTLDEMTGMPIADIFTREHRPHLSEARRIVMEMENGQYTWEARHLRKDGSSFPVLINLSLVKDDDGKPLYRIANVIDITESTEIKEQLYHNNQFLQTLVKASPLAIVAFEPSGIMKLWNPAAERMLGWTAEEAVGRMVPWVRPEDVEQFNYLKNRVAAGEVFTGFETIRQRKDGSQVEVSISAGPVYDIEGIYTGVVGIMQDITSRKRMEDALRESERRFRQIAENINEVFFLTDMKQQGALYVSPAYEAIWGRSRDVLYEDLSAFIEAVHPEDKERVMKARREQRDALQTDIEYRIIRPDGTERRIRSRTFPVFDEDGSSLLRTAGIAEDITDRVAADV